MDQTLDPRLHEAARILLEAGARGVYVFGSAADEAESLPGRAPADLDIAVEGLAPAAFVRAHGEIISRLRFPVDLIDLDHPPPFIKRLRERGKLKRVA